MPKVKISEYSATANSNTDVASINIDEGCAPSGINNAIRAVMGHLKDFQQGTYGDPFNGPVNGTVGATTASTGAFTTLSASSTVTLSGGTANGVAYLNGSKVLTTGSALVFDGTNLGVGVTPSAWASSFRVLQLANGTSLSNNGQTSYYQIGANNYYDGTNYKYIASNYAGFHRFSNAGAYEWHTAASGTAGQAITFTQAMTLDASGNLGIGTTSPSDTIGYGRALDIQSTTGAAIYLRDSDNPTTQYAAIAFDGNASVNNLNIINSSSTGPIRLFTNGAERARITSGGDLLVGTTTGASSTSALMQLKKGGVQWDTGPNGSNGGFNVLKDGTTGVYLTSGATAWSGLSDETMKDIIEPIENASQKISTLRTVIGKYKTDEEGTRRAFLIAQDVEKVLPEAVNENENGKLGLQYTDVIPLMVAAIQEQQALITQLTARITALESA